ncbi:MAG: cobalt ECF transporter T component CbiQ [Ornithinimicrobium sp.]
MGAQHGHLLHFHAHSRVHALPAHLKVVALVGFVVVVVATPGQHYGAFAAYAGILALVRMATDVPWSYLLPRMVVEVPFVVFALLLPFIATGPRMSLGPLTVSEAGLFAAWTLLAKATLSVFAALMLAATTGAQDLIAGLHRLRLPAAMVLILSFMVRYVDVIAGEMQRMRTARISRGFSERSVRAWPVIARSAGALFIRSYERGERVHLAMVARGYDGVLRQPAASAATRQQLLTASALPAAAALVLVTVLVLS